MISIFIYKGAVYAICAYKGHNLYLFTCIHYKYRIYIEIIALTR